MAQWGFLLFHNERFSCDEFLLFRNGWLCRDSLFLLFGVGKFSLQIFLSVLPGDIYLWVFLFRNKRFFATFFNCFVTDGFAAAIFCRGALTEDLVPTISTVLICGLPLWFSAVLQGVVLS